MRMLAAALLLLAVGPAAATARAEEAGISFFRSGQLAGGEHVAFRFDQGDGWREALPRTGPVDEPLYDYALRPGANVRAEAVVYRSGRRIAAASATIPVEADRRYMVHAAVQPDNPTAMCMGCIGPVSAPIAGETGPDARRLWLYWSFNGISHPILF